jgi:hypothetical protein
MPMSAWGLLAAPLMATQLQLPADSSDEAAAVSAAIMAVDLAGEATFAGLAVMDDGAMSTASGGSDTAIDIGSLGVNVTGQTGGVSETDVNDSPTGQISGNIVSDNGGITTVFNNTGNGVIFQSTVNVNIFTQPAEVPTN